MSFTYSHLVDETKKAPTVISIRFPENLTRSIDILCEKISGSTGTVFTRSQFVRLAIESYLREMLDAEDTEAAIKMIVDKKK
jgi:metal-responsive CopG/Arc/MetJ family transcriptional regulator